jgi:hypothetical protein
MATSQKKAILFCHPISIQKIDPLSYPSRGKRKILITFFSVFRNAEFEKTILASEDQANEAPSSDATSCPSAAGHSLFWRDGGMDTTLSSS